MAAVFHMRMSRRAPLLMLLTVCLLVCSVASAWSCTGHMLIAEIARRHLTEANRAKADAMAAAFSESGPFAWTPDFVHLACWPDDLKSWRQYAMSSWHFIDMPYNPEGIPLPPGAEVTRETMTVVSAARSMVTALKHATSSKSPSYVRLFSLVNLLHFIGDVHQPLHAASLFSSLYPNGDRGGNAQLITVRNKTLKLHALWDQMCQPNPHRARRPYSESEYAAHIRDMADYLEASYMFPTRMRAMANPQIMAEESHAFAVNTTYVGVENGTTLTEEYLLDCKRVAEGRVTLAGLRLASILNPILAEMEDWKPASGTVHDREALEMAEGRTLVPARWVLAVMLVTVAFLAGALSTRHVYERRKR